MVLTMMMMMIAKIASFAKFCSGSLGQLSLFYILKHVLAKSLVLPCQYSLLGPHGKHLSHWAKQ